MPGSGGAVVVAVAVDRQHRGHHLVPEGCDQRGLEEAAQDEVAEAPEAVDVGVAGPAVEGVGRLVRQRGAGRQLGGEVGMGLAEGAGGAVEQPAQVGGVGHG